MVSLASPALSQDSDSVVNRRRGLESFCLSFLALFLELMAIRWAPAVVRLARIIREDIASAQSLVRSGL